MHLDAKHVRLFKSVVESYGDGALDLLEFRQGGRHIKVYFDNQFVCIMPNGNGAGKGRGTLNNIAQLRRAVEGRGSFERRFKTKSEPQDSSGS